jgi:tRNA-modifying protein YgfZ
MNAPEISLGRAELAAQQRRLHEGAGFARLGDYTHLLLLGKDRQVFLNGMCTQSIRELVPGRGCEAFLTNVQGKVVGYGWVSCHDEQLQWITAPGQATVLSRHLDKYIIREDVQIEDQSARWDHWLIVGPAARERLNGLFDASRLERPGDHVECRLNDGVSRLHMLQTGPWRLLLTTPAGHAEPWAQRLAELGLFACSESAAELWRLETGCPLQGVDITTDNLPQEVDRNAEAISFTKGCYLGQETVARLDALGHVNRRLMGLRLPGEAAWDPGTEILKEGKVAARITSSAFSPRHGAVIGMGYVRRGWDKPGEVLATDGGPAVVGSFPLLADDT